MNDNNPRTIPFRLVNIINGGYFNKPQGGML